MIPDGSAPKRAMIPDAPPLRVWILVVSLLVLGLSLLAFLEIREISGVNARFRSHHRQRIHEFAQRVSVESRQRVVILGTSLLFRSARTHNLVKMAKELGLGRMRFLILARPQGSFYDYLPLMDSILDLSPDLLLIESDLLFSIEYVGFCSREFLRRLPGLISRRIRGGVDKGDGRTRMQRDPQRYLKRRQQAMRQRMALPPVRPGLIRAAAQRLRSQGVRLAVVDIPRAAPLEMVKNRQRDLHHREFIDYLQAKCRIPWLTYPGELRPYLFRDYSHFTPEGGRVFLNWLLPQVRSLLQAKDPV